MPIILTKKSRKIFPEGTYRALIENIEKEASKFDQEKEVVKIQFKTEYKPKPNEASWKITMSCTASLHENSKLNGVVERLTGKQLKEEEGFDMESLIGQECFVQVDHQTSDAGKIYAKVVDVLPIEGESQKEKPF